MAISVVILSSEKGRNTCTFIASSQEEADEAANVIDGEPKKKFLGVDTSEAAEYLGRAWQVMDEKWESGKR
ncbi:hypothetical protein [Selenomonas sp. AB3002]|uniref:hypothetical protein n=1 Tax=Selenomonas sp. AB3002 TaxID=1392502 RepID=UPI000497C334